MVVKLALCANFTTILFPTPATPREPKKLSSWRGAGAVKQVTFKK
jgi:hypothetical protein